MVDRRVFLHIDEFGPEGTVHLPHLMCLSDPLVVWSPVAPLFERPHTFYAARHQPPGAAQTPSAADHFAS